MSGADRALREPATTPVDGGGNRIPVDAAQPDDAAQPVDTAQPGATGGAGLPGIAEPLALRDAWWEAERRGEVPPDLVTGVAGEVWAAWGAHLAGVDATWLAAVALGYRRELWLWLVGERTWEQALAGLAGRVLRRLAT